MKYEVIKEHKNISRLTRLVDKYGVEINHCIEYDSDTGYAIVLEHYDGPNGIGPMVRKEKFYPEAQFIVDDIARPDENQLGNLRMKHTGKRTREIE